MLNYTNVNDFATRNAFEQLETLLRRQDPAAQYQYIEVVFPATADQDVIVQHKLTPPTPNGVYYQVVKADRPCNVYQDTASTAKAWTSSYIVLRCDTPSAAVTLCVIVPTAGLIATGIVGPAYVPTVPVPPTPASGHDFNVAIITGAAITNYYISKDVAAGKLTIDGAAILTAASFTPPYTITFTANFSGDPFQHVGFATDLSTLGDRAIISTYDTSASGIYARTNVSGGVETRTLLTSVGYGVTHDWKIVWGVATVDYYMDNVLLATHALAITNPLFVVASDSNVNGSRLVVTNLSELL